MLKNQGAKDVHATGVEPDASAAAQKPKEGVAGPKRRRRRSLAKAATWRLVGSLDTLVLSFVTLTVLGPYLDIHTTSLEGNARIAGLIAATETVTKIVLYYVHEQCWGRAQWGFISVRDAKVRETRRRSLLKTASWRILATVDTILLAFLFTGSVGAALSIGSLEILTKMILYYFHERAWERITKL